MNPRFGRPSPTGGSDGGGDGEETITHNGHRCWVADLSKLRADDVAKTLLVAQPRGFPYRGVGRGSGRGEGGGAVVEGADEGAEVRERHPRVVGQRARHPLPHPAVEDAAPGGGLAREDLRPLLPRSSMRSEDEDLAVDYEGLRDLLLLHLRICSDMSAHRVVSLKKQGTLCSTVLRNRNRH